MKLLFLLLLAAASVAALEKCYRAVWHRKLEVKICFQPEPVYEGERAILLETIENQKRLPLSTLQVEFLVERGLKFGREENASQSDKQYKRDIFAVGALERISRKIPFICVRRGYYQIKKVNLSSKSLSIKSVFYLERPIYTYLYVYPKRISAARLRLPMKYLGGIIERQRGIVEDPLAFAGIRDYDLTDPMSKINWKASARQGSLMVNQYDSSCSLKVSCFLDVEDVTIWNHREIHEEGIRLAASILGELVKKSVSVELQSNGVDCLAREPVKIPEGSGKGQAEKLNRSLSRLVLEEKRRPRPVRELLEESRRELETSGKAVLLITENREEKLIQQVKSLADRGIPVLWLGTFYRGEGWKGPGILGITYLNWEVEHEG